VIVLGIADRQRVPRREPKRIERTVKTSRLTHTLGQCHHSPGVKEQHERQFERPNHVEQAGRLARIRVDQRLTGAKRYAAPA
jgi:hypothetical protein